MVPGHVHIVVNGFRQHAKWDPTDQYTCILTNNAQELTPYRFEFKYDSNRIRKYFRSVPRFEPGSQG
jgi:hypothetical protein